jgi:photosystem II stability/assembly factor-like uncharacterized protein
MKPDTQWQQLRTDQRRPVMTREGGAWIATTVVAALVALFALAGPATAATIPVSSLAEKTHIHGLAVDRGNPSSLLIATHHGLYRAGPDGEAALVSEVQDFMGFNAHPHDADTLFASGHPAGGGNLGFVASRDGGRTWTQISPGHDGPVDFHQMTVSAADPDRIYGAYGGLQVSEDGGSTWRSVGPAPEGLIDLSASANNSDVLYAATETGLLVSLDAGEAWSPLLQGPPVTLVEATGEGIFAFVYGKGLLWTREDALEWTTLSADWGNDYLLHLAVDPTSGDRMFAATGHGVVLESGDGGRTWSAYGR